MSIEKLRPSFTFTADRLRELEAIAPEAFADGRINWDAFREALGAYLEEEGPAAEHFGLFWPGKRDARRLAALLSTGTLIPAPGEGVNEDDTHNVFIEGDNLEVLKLLQKSYAGRVKMIYIDPPYNTGNDFVYSDNFTDPLEHYLRITGQADEAGQILTTNPKTSGRFHSNWLNMMYPRLRLARSLLSENGVIFVSIDDNEVHNLRQVINEIFGEENCLAEVIWQKVYSPRMDAKGYSNDHDYILVYRCSEYGMAGRLPFEQNESQFSAIDVGTNEPYRPRSLRKEGKNSRRKDRPNLFYPLVAPDGSEVFPIRSDGSEGCWRWSKTKYDAALAEGLIEWVEGHNGWQVYVKQFYNKRATKPPSTIWLHTEVGHNHEAADELKKIFDGELVLDNPKPVRLIQRMLELNTSPKDDIILDFFAGSCTTAQAVAKRNREDGGNRQFIMIQLPEPTAENSTARSAGYDTIADIGKERIRRVIAKMQAERAGQLDLQEREMPEDLGFRVFKLARSHYKMWQDYQGDDLEQVETLFDRFETPLVDGWQPEDLLTEIMLMEGFPLDSAITSLPEFQCNEVYRVESDACAHRLFVCLDETIRNDTIAQLQLQPEDVFVCLDSALTDQAKARLSDACNLKII